MIPSGRMRPLESVGGLCGLFLAVMPACSTGARCSRECADAGAFIDMTEVVETVDLLELAPDAAPDMATPGWSLRTIAQPAFGDVWGSGATSVFGVGGPGGTLIVHSGDGGSSWQGQFSMPGPAAFYGVWGSSATRVFAVGS